MDDNRDFKEKLNELRGEVERKVNRSVRTPADFEYLSEDIKAVSRLCVSPTTLKRVWGYMNDAGAFYRPGNFTLRALARYVGYREFEDFVERDHTASSQSAVFFGDMVESANLPKGTYVRVAWHPGRECVLHHLFDVHFEVVETRNSKLMKGDIVSCCFFVQNAPLYFNSIHREGVGSMSYIAGSSSGVRFEILGQRYDHPANTGNKS